MQLNKCNVFGVICLQQSVDRISRSHSVHSTAVKWSENIEGICYSHSCLVKLKR